MADDWRAVFGGGAALDVYEDVLVPRLFMPLAEHVLDLAEVQAGDRVLDIACGPGTVALAAAKRGARVTGCDLSPAMLDRARAASADVEWLETAAAPLTGIADESFDVVTCQQGLQFFPDRAAAVAEWLRVLVPGGRAVAAVWGPLERSPAFAALDAAVGEVLGAAAREQFGSGPWGFADPEALRSLFAGFDDVQVEQRTIDVEFENGAEQLASILATSPVADGVAALAPEAAKALLDAIRSAVGDGAVRSTMQCNFARSRKR